MPLLFINFRNSEYHARDDGEDYATPEAALASGVKSAAAMATDEIGRGHRSSAVEVSVADADGIELLCSVVSVSVSPLLLTMGAEPIV